MPSLAVIATWILTAGWLLLLGLPVAVLIRRRFGTVASIRIGLWWGLAVAVLVLLALNFFVPLRSSTAVVSALAISAVTAALAGGIALLLQRRPSRDRASSRRLFPLWSLIMLGALALSLIPLAHATFGAANQWDAGLYHLNTIQYASEYRVIPGLANLHDRFGVTNSQHLLTALLTNSGWGIDAFRLQVGFFVFLFGLDLALRVVDSRTGAPRVGTIVMLLSAFGLIPFLLSNPDELITSPTPDSVAMLITIVGAAYLADGLTSRATALASTGIVVLAIAASVRTQLWAFAVIAAVVTVICLRRGKQGFRRPAVITMAAGVVSGGLLVATQVRDAIQSGWLLFPLDLLPLPVDWKAYDPAASRLWIVSWARTPGAAPEEVMGNWSWVGGWATRSMGDWAIQLALGLLALATTVWLLRARGAHGQGKADTSPSAALWLLIPAVLAVGLWFLSAPDPRFAWGQLVLLGAIPAAVALAGTFWSKAVPIAGGIAVLAIIPATLAVLPAIDGEVAEGETVQTFAGVPWTVSAALEPVPSPALATYTLPTGEELITPTSDDRCWTAFPLCRPYPNDTLVFRGESVQDGFASRLWQE